MAKRITVINFKGGVGKTTLAFHLGAGLSRYHNQRVLLVDVDHQSSLSNLCLGTNMWQALPDQLTINALFQHFTGSVPMPGSEIIVPNFMGTRMQNPIHKYQSLDLVPSALALDDTEIEMTGYHDPVGYNVPEWSKRTLLCRWIESTGVDDNYDYIIFDCPPATKIVSQNAIAASHGYIIPVVPDLLMQLGVAHLIGMIRDGIDRRLNALPHDPQTAIWIPETTHVGIVVTRIKTAGRSPYTMNHTDGLRDLRTRWRPLMISPLIEEGTGVAQATRLNVPVFDRNDDANISGRGFVRMFRRLVTNVKRRIDAI